MDSKVRERRRAVNRERGRRRAGWFLVAAVILVAVGLFFWIRSADVFSVKKVTTTAVEHVSTKDIAAATAEARGINLLQLETGTLEEHLLALPYVRSAAVHRRFPDTLEIVLEEYEAAVCVQTAADTHWLVSADGRVLEKRRDPTLPLLVPVSRINLEPGSQLPPVVAKALVMVDAFADPSAKETLPKVEQIAVSQGGELTVALDGGIELRVGDPTELKQKLKVAGTIIQQYLRDEKQLEYVDVRVANRPAVKSK